VGRPHLVGIKALQSGTSCLLRETNSGDIRYNQVLGVHGKEIFVTVKGGFTIISNAIECLAVTIDGVPYRTPELFGRQMATFPDAETTPPVVPLPPTKAAGTKAAPTKAPAR
jgi:hypothetical protein